MGNFIKHIFGTLLFLGFLASLTFCENEDNLEHTGELSISITGNPVADPNIKAIVLAIKQVDARSAYSGWITLRSFDEEVTFDMLELQSGETLLLTENILPAGIYTKIRLDLNMEGSYIEFEDGQRKYLFADEISGSRYQVNGGFKIHDNKFLDLIIDWDLNKGIIKNEKDENLTLMPTMRFILREEAASVKGEVTLQEQKEYVMIYAFRNNDFNYEETNNASLNPFSKAVNSARMSGENTFILPFINRGIYDFFLVEYDKDKNFKIIYEYQDLMLSSGETKEIKMEALPDDTENL